jgi:hypothetical protein
MRQQTRLGVSGAWAKQAAWQEPAVVSEARVEGRQSASTMAERAFRDRVASKVRSAAELAPSVVSVRGLKDPVRKDNSQDKDGKARQRGLGDQRRAL